MAPQLIAARNVVVRLGGSEDHNRNFRQVRISFQLAEHLSAIDPRQVQVQNDQLGLRGVHIGAFLPQKPYCLLSVIDRIHVEMPLAFPQNFAGQVDIGEVVVDQQNLRLISVRRDRKLSVLPLPAT